MSLLQETCTGQMNEIVQREFHHRFYNSLQLVASATRTLAQDGLDDQVRLPMLRDLHERVALLAQLHRFLAEPITDDDLADRFKLLCQMVAKAFDRSCAHLDVAVEPPPMSPALARGMMLILVELVTNAFKHGATTMTLSIAIDAPLPRICRLNVRNSAGAGKSGAVPIPLIASQLAHSLGGMLSVDGGAFVDVTVVVPLGHHDDTAFAL